jgi:sec-independent protein translocase protein TatB
MFDIGFWELILIGVVALLVVGPERLPKLARTAGLWIGRGRRMLGNVKAEIDRELKAEELRQIMDKQARSNPLETIIEEPKPKSTAPAGAKGKASSGSDPGQEQKPGAG